MQIDWKTVNEVLECAESWNQDARLIGNVRAGDIAKMCRAIIDEGLRQDSADLALSLSKVVHDECKDAPHDIGLKLARIVQQEPKCTHPDNHLECHALNGDLCMNLFVCVKGAERAL